ncbi:MAG: glucosyl-3-phosphoglycerate synthase [Acidimicrobiales bacterium]
MSDRARRDAEEIAAALRTKGDHRVSVCLPCRNEESTVGLIVDALQAGDSSGLIDELIVIDDRSTDRSAERALAAGAKVVSIEEIHTSHGEGTGKGNALWASLWCTTGDVVVWIDADVITADLSWVARLARPLFEDESVAIVKAAYHRPRDAGGGGRTTELVVRPLLSLLAPALSWIEQPLGGEVAVRRSMIEQLPFMEGWGVEIAMLLDAIDRFGPGAVTQVDLGERRHRHHDLLDLRVQAAEVAATILRRTGVDLVGEPPRFHLPDCGGMDLNLAERPPVRP